jgi:hypothetical protein
VAHRTCFASDLGEFSGPLRHPSVTSPCGECRMEAIRWVPSSGREPNGLLAEHSRTQFGYFTRWSTSSFSPEAEIMGMTRLCKIGPSFCVLLCACGFSLPPPKPDPDLLGCYHLETDLPASYGDSLGYKIPPVIRLAHSAYGQWIVFPTDREWHPSWTVWDQLPSTHLRRVIALHSSPLSQHDSINMIPGDSIDIIFPSAIGRLVFRLGRDGGALRGRAEWAINHPISFMNEGKTVVAWPTSCEGLPRSLERTRYR